MTDAVTRFNRRRQFMEYSIKHHLAKEDMGLADMECGGLGQFFLSPKVPLEAGKWYSVGAMIGMAKEVVWAGETEHSPNPYYDVTVLTPLAKYQKPE